MQILDANTLVGSSVEGLRGSLTVMPAFQDARFGAQLVVVPPNTKAPKPGQRLSGKTLIFVLQGWATLSNSEFYQKIGPGKMVILDAGEERTFQTEKDKFVCLEVRLGAAPPPEPERAVNLVFEPPPMPAAEEPKKPSPVYDEA